MKITIIAIATKNPVEYQSLYEQYKKRIFHFKCDFQILHIKDYSWAEQDEEKYFEIISKKIYDKIPKRSKVIYLDQNGEQYCSFAFAKKLEKIKDQYQNLTFIMGGSIGLPKKMLVKQDVFSFSKMTFTHSMTLLILLEQIFRAFSILNGRSYHK